jgi:dTMP kinase
VAETALMFAARAIHLDNLVRPALTAGAWVLCDRFTDASYAYQGAGRGVARDLLDTLARHVQAGLTPDRTLLLDLPVEDGLRRARQRSGAADRFEREASPFFAAVRAEYLRRAEAEPRRMRVIDAAQSPTQVLAAAIGALADLLPEKR